MLITRSTAKKLIKEKLAYYDGNCISDGYEYAIITNCKEQRVDHVKLGANDIDPIVNKNAFRYKL